MKKVSISFMFVACLISGYFYFRVSSEDLVSSIFFTIGLSGIILSFLRQSKKD